MYQISGLTEPEVISIVLKVARNHTHKTFDCHDKSDIEQQACVIILDKIGDFDITKANAQQNVALALESFLNTIVSRRLNNFYRDKYAVKIKPRKDSHNDEKRRSILHSVSISENPNIHIPDVSLSTNDFNNLGEFEALLPQLSAESLDIIDAILSGQNLSGYFKDKVRKEICHLKESL